MIYWIPKWHWINVKPNSKTIIRSNLNIKLLSFHKQTTTYQIINSNSNNRVCLSLQLCNLLTRMMMTNNITILGKCLINKSQRWRWRRVFIIFVIFQKLKLFRIILNSWSSNNKIINQLKIITIKYNNRHLYLFKVHLLYRQQNPSKSKNKSNVPNYENWRKNKLKRITVKNSNK